MMKKTDRLKLTAYVLAKSPDKQLAQQALDLLKQFFQDADQGIYPLTMLWHIDDDAATAAVSGAAMTPVDDLAPVSVSKNKGQQAQFLDSQRITGLPMFITQAHRGDLIARLGDDTYEEFLYLLFGCLGESMVVNLVGSHRRFFDQLDSLLANTIPFLPMVAIFYLLAYAMLGDAAKVGQFAPLVKLMRQALPIGESETPGAWLMLVG
jgi:hypothetical protein